MAQGKRQGTGEDSLELMSEAVRIKRIKATIAEATKESQIGMGASTSKQRERSEEAETRILSQKG